MPKLLSQAALAAALVFCAGTASIAAPLPENMTLEAKIEFKGTITEQFTFDGGRQERKRSDYDGSTEFRVFLLKGFLIYSDLFGGLKAGSQTFTCNKDKALPSQKRTFCSRYFNTQEGLTLEQRTDVVAQGREKGRILQEKVFQFRIEGNRCSVSMPTFKDLQEGTAFAASTPARDRRQETTVKVTSATCRILKGRQAF